MTYYSYAHYYQLKISTLFHEIFNQEYIHIQLQWILTTLNMQLHTKVCEGLFSGFVQNIQICSNTTSLNIHLRQQNTLIGAGPTMCYQLKFVTCNCITISTGLKTNYS